MNILVTGGSGFIGANLTGKLLEDGHKVNIYDKRKSELYPDICIIGDVRDKENLTSSMHGIDAVYHLAAEHHDNVRPPSIYYDVNVGGAKNLVFAMEKNGVKRLIYTSTAAVYGINSSETSENSLARPFNDYSKSKYKGENVFEGWVKANASRCLSIVRPTVIFGEGNRGNVYNLLYQLASDRFIMVGSGKNQKSMGYVLNLSSFLTFLLNSTPGKNVYNYADKPDLSIAELIRIAEDALGKSSKKYLRIPYLLGLVAGYAFDIFAILTGKTYLISSIRIKKFCADTRLSTNKLEATGFRAPYLLTDGLKRTILSEFINDPKSNNLYF